MWRRQQRAARALRGRTERDRRERHGVQWCDESRATAKMAAMARQWRRPQRKESADNEASGGVRHTRDVQRGTMCATRGVQSQRLVVKCGRVARTLKSSGSGEAKRKEGVASGINSTKEYQRRRTHESSRSTAASSWQRAWQRRNLAAAEVERHGGEQRWKLRRRRHPMGGLKGGVDAQVSSDLC